MSYKLSLNMVAIFLIALAAQPPEAAPFSNERFEITGSGKLYHFEGVPSPGVKPAVTTVKAADIVDCVLSVDPSCVDGATIERDAGGKVYLFMISETVWKVSTHPDCTFATQLNGVVAGNGAFMMAGTHVLSNSKLILQGKVKFAKGTLTPVSIKRAKLSAVSDTKEHYGVGTVSTVDTPATLVCP